MAVVRGGIETLAKKYRAQCPANRAKIRDPKMWYLLYKSGAMSLSPKKLCTLSPHSSTRTVGRSGSESKQCSQISLRLRFSHTRQRIGLKENLSRAQLLV